MKLGKSKLRIRDCKGNKGKQGYSSNNGNNVTTVTMVTKITEVTKKVNDVTEGGECYPKFCLQNSSYRQIIKANKIIEKVIVHYLLLLFDNFIRNIYTMFSLFGKEDTLIYFRIMGY